MQYTCPECREPLEKLDAGWRCRGCRRAYAGREGIPVLTDADHYYGELAQDEMRELLAAIGERGFEAAVVELVPRLGWAREGAATQGRGRYSEGETARLTGHMFDPSRAAWEFLCDVPGRCVLDAGCGTGQIAVALAQTARRVTALDPTWERVAFARERARYCGCEPKMEFVCGGNSLHLPFPDAAFDLVVVNGVLEWVPLSRDGDPTALQVEYLRDVRRVLAPGGELYLAIENRLSLLNLLGGPDPHTGLRFGSVLPRPLADFYSRAVRQQPYRNYIFSLAGYRRLFASAGLQVTRVYAPLPTYQNPRLLVPLNGQAPPTDWQIPGGRVAWRDRVKFVAARLGLKLPGGRYVVPAYSILAKGPLDAQADAGEGFLSRVASVLAEDRALFPAERPGVPTIRSYLTAPYSQSAIIELSLGGRDLMLKLPLTPSSRERAEANVAFLRRLDEARPGLGSAGEAIPRVPYAGEIEGQYVAAETRQPGRTAAGLPDRARRQAARAVAAWLLSLQRASTRRAVLTPELLRPHVSALAELIAHYRPQHAEGLARGAALLEEQLAGSEAPLVISHGDPQAGNFLLDGSPSEVTGVVDWDRGSFDGLPMVDTLAYLAKEDARGGRDIYAQFLRGWGALLDEGPRRADVALGWAELGLADALFRPLALAALLQQAAVAFRTRDPLSLRLPSRDAASIAALIEAFCEEAGRPAG